MQKEFEILNQFLTIRKKYGPGNFLYETVCKYGSDGIAGVELAEEIQYTDSHTRQICKALAKQKMVELFKKRAGNIIYVRQDLNTAIAFETLNEKAGVDLLKVSAALKHEDADDCLAYLITHGTMDDAIMRDRCKPNRKQYIKTLLMDAGLIQEGPNPETGSTGIYPGPGITAAKLYELNSRVTGFLLTINLLKNTTTK